MLEAPEAAKSRFLDVHLDEDQEVVMKAKPGDWLVVRSTHLDGPTRRGQITEIHGTNGSPPFLIRWADTDQTSLVYPGADAHIEPVPSTAGRPPTTPAPVSPMDGRPWPKP